MATEHPAPAEATQDWSALNREIFTLEERGDALDAAAARGRKAQALARERRYREAGEELGRAEQLARGAQRQDLQARYLLAQGLTLGRSRALWEAARAALARAAALARTLEDPALELHALRRELDLSLLGGPPDRAMRQVCWLVGRAEALQRPAEHLEALRVRALLHAQQGAGAEALVDLDRAVALAEAGAAPAAPVRLERALVQAGQGDGQLDDALQALVGVQDPAGPALARAAAAFAADQREDALEALLAARAACERARDRTAGLAVGCVLEAWERRWTTEGLAQVVHTLEARRAR